MRLRVTPEMTARFFDCTIHPVYATFAIVEHGEYASRQAILGFLEPEEDAVGAYVELEHTSSAAVGEVVEITARVIEVDGRSITCAITARGRHGVIAHGTGRQRVVPKRKLQERIAALYTEQTKKETEG
jgi:predicted thioesterase